MEKRLAALVPNILGTSPGQRTRIETWARYLEEYGWKVDFYPFEDASLNEVLYESGRVVSKAKRLASCYARQIRLLVAGPRCDAILVYREAALIGPALLERLARRLRVPMIYDVDDPVFVPYRSPANGWFSLLKCSRKTHTLFRLSDHVIAINNLIGEYAGGFNPSVSIVPNFVDTDHYRPAPNRVEEEPRLVWTGSLSTMQNLSSIAGTLRRLQGDHRVPLRVIGVGSAELPGVDIEARQWSATTEIPDLQGCEIGLVPLIDLSWNRWKFFLKTVQYMAVGLPVVARRMGSNSEVIEDGVNGYLVETADEWYDRLTRLLENPDLRRRMGAAARKTAVERFSAAARMPQVAQILEQTLETFQQRRTA